MLHMCWSKFDMVSGNTEESPEKLNVSFNLKNDVPNYIMLYGETPSNIFWELFIFCDNAELIYSG